MANVHVKENQILLVHNMDNNCQEVQPCVDTGTSVDMKEVLFSVAVFNGAKGSLTQLIRSPPPPSIKPKAHTTLLMTLASWHDQFQHSNLPPMECDQGLQRSYQTQLDLSSRGGEVLWKVGPALA
jgi:hypothetical protein